MKTSTSTNVMKKLLAQYQNLLIDGAGENMLSLIVLKYLENKYFFKIIDSRISFYCNNLDLLPPKT